MARPLTLNYRKLAFETYAPICVFCGFGIEAVLEVAHLDCDSANSAVDNLAILCPTCHRMLDVDLIPTDVVVRLRDEKRKANWRKLLKDAGAKAAATKRGKPGLLSEAARKAVATLRKRKAATAKLVAADSSGNNPEILWTPVRQLPTSPGHGTEFRVRSAKGPQLVAWLAGFEWLHSKPSRVEVLISDDSTLLSPARLARLKVAVERAIRGKRHMSGNICEGVSAWVNG